MTFYCVHYSSFGDDYYQNLNNALDAIIEYCQTRHNVTLTREEVKEFSNFACNNPLSDYVWWEEAWFCD